MITLITGLEIIQTDARTQTNPVAQYNANANQKITPLC